MGRSDYEMAEFTSDLILQCIDKHERIPHDLFKNLQTALGCMILNHTSMGPNVKQLYIHLNSEYSYGHANDLPGFDLGVIYGSAQFCNTFEDLMKMSRLE